jgi:hypothetical protein
VIDGPESFNRKFWACQGLIVAASLDAAPDNFDKVIDGSKAALVEFYAPWYAISR